MKKIICFILLLLPITSYAVNTFYKCTIKGQLVYSGTPCDTHSQVQTTKEVYLGEKLKGKPKTPQQQLQNILKNRSNTSQQRHRVTTSNFCQGVSTLTLRNAVIKDRLMKCHRKKDVLRIYGRPYSKITYSDSRNYDERWFYKLNNGHHLTIYLKEDSVLRWTRKEKNK